MNINEQTRPLFMFVHLTKRTKFLVRVRSFIKRTNKQTFPQTVHELSVHLQPYMPNLYNQITNVN
ncbi:hypothetical protein Hanom_Chr07g00614571 [Helianthus anomalus]